MTRQYVVSIKNVEVKRYPYKIQAIIYCLLNGYYVSTGRGLFSIHPDVTIEKIIPWSEFLKKNRF